MKKILILSSCFALAFALMMPKSVYASENNLDEVVIEIGDNTYEINTFSDGDVYSSIVTEDNGKQSVTTFDVEKGILNINGKIVKADFVKENNVEIPQIQPKSRAANNFSAIYTGTFKVNLADFVDTMAACVSVIAALTGPFGAGAAAVAASIKSIASKAGITALAFRGFIKGEFSYELWHTKYPVQFGNALWPQIASKYKNVKVDFKLANTWRFNWTALADGGWWYSQKPF